jgi:hypothetical protein
MGMEIAFKIFFFCVITWGIVILVIAWRLDKSKPKKEITKKYSMKIIYQSWLPFGSWWKKHVHEDDLSIMEQYQNKIKVLFAFMFVSVIVIFICLYILYYLAVRI